MTHNTEEPNKQDEIAETSRRENKKQFFDRKLKVFTTYYQTRELTPTIVIVTTYCDRCGLELYGIGFNISFEHKDKQYSWIICDDCCSLNGIQRISRIKIINSLKKEIKNDTITPIENAQDKCCCCRNGAVTFGHRVEGLYGRLFLCARHFYIFQAGGNF